MSAEPPDEEAGELEDRISAAPPRAAERVEGASLPVQWLHVLAIVAMTAALIGFVTGTRGEEEVYRRAPREPVAIEGDVPLAPTYAAMRERPIDRARERHAAAIEAMRGDHPALTDEVPPRDDEAVRAELARRATLRAYNGAPPRIPHPIAANGPLECVACHQAGMRIGGAVAMPASHRELTSCTQCHVPNEGEMPGPRLPGGPPAETTFVGMAAPERGPRARPEAPPQIPHSTRMRERCESCHGVWAGALRTTHPWRQSCTQCHAPSATMDQQPAAIGGGPPVAPMPGEP